MVPAALGRVHMLCLADIQLSVRNLGNFRCGSSQFALKLAENCHIRSRIVRGRNHTPRNPSALQKRKRMKISPLTPEAGPILLFAGPEPGTPVDRLEQQVSHAGDHDAVRR